MKKIYLILDMINDLVHQDGPGGKGPLAAAVRDLGILERSAMLAEKARNARAHVGFVRLGFSPDYRECPANSPVFGPIRQNGMCKLGSWGTEVHPDIEVRPEDLDIVKHRVSPFRGTNLELTLRTMGIERIYCSGVSTQAVVQATIREAHDLDFEAVLIEDCCAAHDLEEHDRSVKSVSRFCHVVKSGDVTF